MAVIIDRRLNDKGKSSVNRRKFIERVKDTLKEGVKGIIRDTNMKDLVSGKGKKVKVPLRNLDEPHFHPDGSGENDMVRPGNDRFVPGDKIKRPQNGTGGRGNEASQDGEGEDSFTFHLTKEEFYDLFFENCALPDMVKQNIALLHQEVNQRCGFTSEGSPSMMNIMRSMRNAKGRRSGLRAMKNKKLKELVELEAQLTQEIECRNAGGLDASIEIERLERVRHDIEVLKRRIKAIPFIDPLDLRYNNWHRVKKPTTQAVVVCIMDVSGSMDERKKELAKTFYLLLYLFLIQNYNKIEIEYITYHSRAQIVDEQNFYYGTDTGGTITSSGLDLAHQLITEKYPPALWNIYIAHSSDGDNWASDNEVCKDIIVNKLLPIIQYYAYVQINPDDEAEMRASWGSNGMMEMYEQLATESSKVDVALVGSEDQVYPVFIKLFERKTQ